MSFSGYEQLICFNGHYRQYDTYNVPDVCDCGAEWAITNIVDTTNGTPGQGLIPKETIDSWVIKPAITETCSCCGNTKLLSEAVYKIPTVEEVEESKWYF